MPQDPQDRSPAGRSSRRHDLALCARHHYASALLAAGESVVAVAERLGHENATLVLSSAYGLLMPLLPGAHPPGRERGMERSGIFVVAAAITA